MSGKTKRKEANAGRTDKKKQRQDDQTACVEKQIAQPAVSASPVGRLYQDALQSVFEFCGLADLSRVMAVRRSWSAAAKQMPCAGLSVRCTMARLEPLCSSALSKHVASIVDSDASELTCEAVSTLSLRVPHLTGLECSVVPSLVSQVILPPRLQTLQLDLSVSPTTAINAVISGISRLTALTKLKLALPSFLPAISFAPLTAAATLRDLHLRSALSGSQPTTLQLGQLRTIPQIRRMVVARLSSESLAQLLLLPHELRWRQIHIARGVDAAASAALCSLPSLTHLTAECCIDISFLLRLIQLCTLNLHMVQDPWPATIAADAVVGGLSCCTQLTTLGITAPLTSKHLSVLLPRLPLLSKLTFWWMNELESLSFLSSGPVVGRLRSLRLYRCCHSALKLSELKHVYALTALEDLTIDESFAGEVFDSLELWLHTPPSKLMPQLKQFRYVEPTDDDEDDEGE